MDDLEQLADQVLYRVEKLRHDLSDSAEQLDTLEDTLEDLYQAILDLQD